MFIDKNKTKMLLEKYGSPLYVYDENILRLRCKEMHNLFPHHNMRASYSVKANTNLEFLKIVKDEDLDADVMSPGEIFMLLQAGFSPDRIMYIGNNVSPQEMQYAIDSGVLVSCDSLSQLETYGNLNPHSNVVVRFNPGFGAGHNDKVVTGGKKTKFGIQKEFIPQVKELLKKYDLRLVGINQHIGSLFMDATPYVDGVKSCLAIATEFPGLQFIDFGGGFGVPYHEDEQRLDLQELGEKVEALLQEFLKNYDNKDVVFKTEPGRYISAECGVLLGTVYSIKENYNKKYVGTDLGFNVLIRPTMYDSYHAIQVLKNKESDNTLEEVTIVGNICESGDVLAKDRLLPHIDIGDIIMVGNAGAYGYSMSSNYNCRLRPSEVLIRSDDTDVLIRRRDTLQDLLQNFE